MGVEAPEYNKGSRALEDWKSAIRLGVRYRTMFGKSKEWTRFKNYMRGFWGKDVIPVNITYAIGRSLIPQVYFRNPRVAVIAKRPGFTAHAWMLESIDNYLIRELGIKYELKSHVLDCFTCGRGPGILGYDSEYGYSSEFSNAEFEDESLTSFGKKGEKIEYRLNVKPGMPWYLRCNPTDFIVPWGTRKWEDAQWFAFRKMRRLQDINEDPKYSNKVSLKAPFQSRLEGSHEGAPDSHRRMLEEDPKNDWCELWEIHDQRSGRVFVMTLDHGKFLRDDIDELQLEGLPARVLGFNEDPDYFWWTPDARIFEPQQLEMNDVRTMARKHRRVALLKVLVDKNVIKKEEITKLLDTDPKAVVRGDPGPTGDIRKAVALFQSHVPPDFSLAAREIREDIRELVGFSRNQMGSFEESSGRRTAHEAEIVRAASMIRIDERRDIMADHLESVVRGLNQIIFARWGAERIIDIVGPDGVKYWIRFTGPEIKGEFHYKINPEEALPSDRRTRRAEMEKFMEITQNAPPDAGINKKYLFESWARQHDWIDPKLLLPAEGPGRSPERPMMFQNFMGMMGRGGAGSFPGLARGA